jgi:hypothetical protein
MHLPAATVWLCPARGGTWSLEAFVWRRIVIRATVIHDNTACKGRPVRAAKVNGK